MSDEINPPHYRGFSNGAQVIDIAERLNYNRGSVIKYVARAGRKQGAATLTDLEKAHWYLEREIARVKADAAGPTPATKADPAAATTTPLGDVLAGFPGWIYDLYSLAHPFVFPPRTP